MNLTVEHLGRLEPVRGLSNRRLEELARLCRVETHALGSDPMVRLAGGGEFVYLLHGELKIVLADGSMRLLVGGCDAANWPIGYKTAPPVSSKAVTEVALLRIDFDLLDIMMTWDELAVAVVTAQQQAQADSTTLTGIFSAQALTSTLLAQLPPAHIHELLRRFQRIKVKRGEMVVREGETGDYFYLIESGRCRVSRQIAGADVEVAELTAGETFGEEALLSESTRNASVQMKTAGVLLRLAKPDFAELLQAPLLHALERDEAAEKVAAGGCWLDVRYPAEFAESHLPEAFNLPLNEIRAAFGLLDKTRDYVVYCQSGRRSSAAAFLLAQHGFRAWWLRGGLGLGESA